MCLGYLIGRQLYPTFAGLEASLKIVFEVIAFFGPFFGFDLAFVVGVEALAVEDGARYCFQASTPRAAKFSCILQQDELAFAAGAAFKPTIGFGDRLGV